MSTVTRVPQTSTMDAADLSAEDARATLLAYGRWKLVRDSFVRFRYGDGFSHSRALGLQLTLSIVPLGIAFVGLATTIHADRVSRVIRETLLADDTREHRPGRASDARQEPTHRGQR